MARKRRRARIASRQEDGEVIAMTTATEDREEVVATTPEGLREQALIRLKKRRDLKAHAFVYVLVNAVIWGIWVAVGVGSHS